jgi:hypothetical protein
MKLSEAFPSNFLKAADLQGRRVTVTISHVKFEDIGDDHKPVVYFRGKDKGLVLNKTNGNMIAEVAGNDDTDNWGGVAIVLYPTRVDFQGKRVDAIRCDRPEPGQVRQAAPPPPPTIMDEDGEEVPF